MSIERRIVVIDDGGRPFRAYVLDDGTRVDAHFFDIAPDMARANPVPGHYPERVDDDFRTHSDASAIND